MTVRSPADLTAKGLPGARKGSCFRGETPSARLSATTAHRRIQSPSGSQARYRGSAESDSSRARRRSVGTGGGGTVEGSASTGACATGGGAGGGGLLRPVHQKYRPTAPAASARAPAIQGPRLGGRRLVRGDSRGDSMGRFPGPGEIGER